MWAAEMQKVLRRAQNAQRLKAKKSKDFQKSKERAELKIYNQSVRRIQRNVANNIKDARKNRRIDWEAGSLAPRRDVGDKAETYGTTSLFDFHTPNKLPKDRPKWCPIDAGDRVVVTKGRQMGKIGAVSEVQMDKGMVVVPGINPADVWVPEYVRQEHDEDQSIVTVQIPIPVEHVKLVYPLPDPKTGILRDVVIDRVERFGRRDRLVPGSNIVIKGQPQPEEEEDEETYPADTPTLSVDEETFNPPLLFPPMPMSVIDELRNKYSPHRTRHDWEYLEKKRQEDEREEARKGLGKTMRTPLQELAELRARQKESQKRELTDEQLAQIGAIMAQEMARVSLSTKTPVISTSTESVEQIDKSV